MFALLYNLTLSKTAAMRGILSAYPDIVSTALLPMIVSIFALAFPLLIQTITRIDDKYKSTKLIKAFRTDWISKMFLASLIAAIVSYVIWLFQFPPLVDWGWIVDNSALLLVLLSTLVLVIMLFLLVYLIYIYYVPEKLLDRLIEQHNQSNEEAVTIFYRQALSKMLNYSIKTVDVSLTEKLWTFYFEIFADYRKDKEGEEIIYSKVLYDTFLEAHEVMCEQDKKNISFSNVNNLYDLLLDSFQHTVHSQNTFYFLWQTMIQSIDYNRDDFVLSLWRKSHQLLNLFITEIRPEYEYSEEESKMLIVNETEINNRKKERDDFFEFHYALGGLLMYKKKYTVIEEAVNFTQNYPPKYVLVPESMQDVIDWYMKIDSKELESYYYFQQKFPFPDVHGVLSGDVVRVWIMRYISILFIRQYSLTTYYYGQNRLELYKLPDELSELRRWRISMDSLTNYVNDYMRQKETLEDLGFELFYDDSWFKKNSKPEPAKLIESFQERINAKFTEIKSKQPVDKTKEQLFEEKAIEKLLPVMKQYADIFNNTKIENYRSHIIQGKHHFLDKTAFAENQDVSYLNSDEITAEAVATEFQYYSVNTFIMMQPKKYLLKEINLFQAVDKLGPHLRDDFAIITVGLNIDYFAGFPVDGLEKQDEQWYYKEMPIMEINNYGNEFVSQSLFVISKNDMPHILFNKPPQKRIDKYYLKRIEDKFNIFTSLVDLNTKEGKRLIADHNWDNPGIDLEQSVLAFVDINAEIRFKLGANCVQLKVFSQFDDRGSASDISDVKPIVSV